MPELLLELFSEEIPARMQARAAGDLARLLKDGLTDAGFDVGAIQSYAGPRRLTAVIPDLAARSPDVREERKGPRVGAPEKAVAGFLRGAGLDSLDACETRSDKKGDYYVAVIERPGQSAQDALAAVVPTLVTTFPWPKSMRWGAGTVRWVRPLQRIACVFDGAPVSFAVAGLEAGGETEGHRLLGRGPFAVRDFADYRARLEGEGFTLIDAADRRAKILADAQAACAEAGLELVEDQGLLDEVAGLAEWPVTLLGAMDPAFLDLPPEVIRLSMRTHQKYFAVRDPKAGGLAPHFVVVSNQTAPDGGAAIAAGNARVLSARLNDARFFWDNDRKTPLAEMAGGLSDIVFHAKLGSVADKVERVAMLARALAPHVEANADLAETAARLAKADLVSEMVYEFPELQGVMGRYYALIEAGFDPLDPKRRKAKGEEGLRALKPADAKAVADAVRDHYKPQGPADSAPADPVGIAAALADKLDTLVGFWAIDEKPTGSKDPFALRRAALGVVRILLDNEARLALTSAISGHVAAIPAQADPAGVAADLLAFVYDRLRVHLRDQGRRHDHVDAVLALGGDDLVAIVKRVDALAAFLATEDGAELTAGYKRAANILKAEEKKDGAAYDGPPDPAVFDQTEEQALWDALTQARRQVHVALQHEDFEGAMAAVSPLRPAVDSFFDAVTVNAGDPAVRRNRLLLLSQIRDALAAVAEFSKLEG